MQKKSYTEGYTFKSYKAYKTTYRHPEDNESIIIILKRIQKKHNANRVVEATEVIMIEKQSL